MCPIAIQLVMPHNTGAEGQTSRKLSASPRIDAIGGWMRNQFIKCFTEEQTELPKSQYFLEEQWTSAWFWRGIVEFLTSADHLTQISTPLFSVI
jgi:hypothetical protein